MKDLLRKKIKEFTEILKKNVDEYYDKNDYSVIGECPVCYETFTVDLYSGHNDNKTVKYKCTKCGSKLILLPHNNDMSKIDVYVHINTIDNSKEW